MTRIASTLTDKEFEVLQYSTVGLTAKEIAAKLAVTPSTIGTYRERINKKLHCKTVIESVYILTKKGIL